MKKICNLRFRNLKGEIRDCPLSRPCPLHSNYWRKVWDNRRKAGHVSAAETKKIIKMYD